MILDPPKPLSHSPLCLQHLVISAYTTVVLPTFYRVVQKSCLGPFSYSVLLFYVGSILLIQSSFIWLIQNVLPYALRNQTFIIVYSIYIQSLIKYVVYIPVNLFCPFRPLFRRTGPTAWPHAPAWHLKTRNWPRKRSWNCVC